MSTQEGAGLRDRVAGVMLGAAVGDALGAGYEFESAPLGPDGPQMIGGGLGGFAPGEWTDDTSMAWCVLEVAARGGGLCSERGLTAVARNFRAWFDSGPADIGIQTRQVLWSAGPAPTAAECTSAAAAHFARNGRSAGNGSLMRTAPVALAHLGDTEAIVRAATAVSALTHGDPRTGQACVLWSLAIDRAVREQVLDIRSGLTELDDEARGYWTDRIDEAEQGPPGRFTPNGWVVTALQAAWSAIHHTAIHPTVIHDSQAPAESPGPHLADSLVTAIGIGNDTDTVAAIAGGLLGARWGAAAVPADWRRISHGYPGLTGEELIELALSAAGG
ncbi:ADP-ribosylglycohydrolase family protein [Rhodococcus sp. IEGM 1408]|uniref:ADP-ribosylglycohydrolase family protein n=1 Tax=Rhodococcus sp. IEGM 1408 TaxID=3082220 RepID=UPI0029552EC7|nr:ADP-ribosylglycohydrolase family protein [Rhodococcus sp. IEGM 1408]MDV8002135.1 ADP-ribosylglycohydrolase family protein [Rhodococcus sp. IEGM 1408]